MNLQEHIIKLGHQGHQGIVRTKQLLRNHVWFPDLDKKVEAAVKTCLKCQINTDSTKFSPLSMSKLPDGPWEELSIDFYGPLKNGKYLMVIIDDYSRYPLIKLITSTAAKTIIPALQDILGTFGIPKTIKSDNGPPFNSREFGLFSQNEGFTHRRIRPLWPRANGICERFMKNLTKVVKNCSIGQNKFEIELLNFLRSNRAAPHPSTKFSPNQLLFKTSSTTTTLPINRKNQTPSDERG